MAGRNIIPNPHKSARREEVLYTAINNAQNKSFINVQYISLYRYNNK